MSRSEPAAAFLALGSNVGDRAGHLAFALQRVGSAIDLAGVSGVYESEPVGYRDQPLFLNMVVRVRTSRPPRDLLDLALGIEAERGRERSFQGAPRTLDIDLLLYGSRVVREPGLRVPHPRMAERPFVLVPLLEIEPDVADPETGSDYASALAGLSASGLRRIMDGEELLNGENG